MSCSTNKDHSSFRIIHIILQGIEGKVNSLFTHMLRQIIRVKNPLKSSNKMKEVSHSHLSSWNGHFYVLLITKIFISQIILRANEDATWTITTSRNWIETQKYEAWWTVLGWIFTNFFMNPLLFGVTWYEKIPSLFKGLAVFSHHMV